MPCAVSDRYSMFDRSPLVSHLTAFVSTPLYSVAGKDYESRACCEGGGITPSNSCPKTEPLSVGAIVGISILSAVLVGIVIVGLIRTGIISNVCKKDSPKTMSTPAGNSESLGSGVVTMTWPSGRAMTSKPVVVMTPVVQASLVASDPSAPPFNPTFNAGQ